MLSTTAIHSSPKYLTGQSRPTKSDGYGRARLRIGISGVGFWVVVSCGLLALDVGTARAGMPGGILGDLLPIGMLLSLYAVIQLPFDWMGGYLLPKRYGRPIEPAPKMVLVLLRGVGAHLILLMCSALALYTGGVFGGVAGAYVAGLIWVSVLAVGRNVLARTVADFDAKQCSDAPYDSRIIPTELMDSADEGFTGGITGFVTPGKNILPAAWRETLTPTQFALIRGRREAVIRSGAWRAGRLAALAFTGLGLLIALMLAGPESAGTGVGVVETSLWFTLWSFLGLLFLPTLARRAVYRIDQQMLADGHDLGQYHELWSVLDGLQDDEPTRPRWVERIFHPIPSVMNRRRENATRASGFWDVARTSVYLGMGGMSLLTRSVHCNVGRPALWVWLPTD